MSIVTVTAGSWQSVVTTTADTAIQNQSPREVYITTESVGGLDLKEGLLLAPWFPVIIKTGYTVSASVFGGSADIFYMEA